MKTILGYDIGGSKVSVVEGTFQGEILRSETFINGGEPFSGIHEKLEQFGKKIINEAGDQGNEVAAVSVSIGGPLDIEKGIILSPPNLPGWRQIHLKDALQKSFNLPVFIEHDGNAGALAEHKFGAGRGATNMIFLTMGTGLGAGLIINGDIYHGTTDTAGEVGHIRVADDGPEAYGRRGAWEGLASGAGLAKMLHLRYPKKYPDDISPREVIELAMDGEQEIRELIREVGEWLGKGIAILVDILNPDLIVVGTLGYVLGDLVLEPATRVMKEEALRIPAEACDIVPAQLGRALGETASLMAAIHAYEKQEAVSSPILHPTTREKSKIHQQLMAGQGTSIEKASQIIIHAYQQGKKLIVFGNGGSAAQAQHLAGELVGRFDQERAPLPAVALTADSSVVTCIGNDYHFDDIFSRQVSALTEPGDVVLGLTTSGRSANVIRGLKAAANTEASTIALTGEEGLSTGVADLVIRVPSSKTARIQEEHLFIIHTWCEKIDQVFSH